MKTTVEIPEELFRRSKATAALRGQSFKELLAQALQSHLDRDLATEAATPAWRKLFGRADPEEIHALDRMLDNEFGRVDPADWE